MTKYIEHPDDDEDYERDTAKAMSQDGYEPGICPHCNGSGEGQHEGTICYACKGKGEL